jgi:hypothetical protein
MAVTEFETTAEVRAHRLSFITFERLVLFAVMHITLTLGCLALAFVGHLPVIGLLLGVGGTLALIVGFVVAGANSEP